MNLNNKKTLESIKNCMINKMMKNGNFHFHVDFPNKKCLIKLYKVMN